MCVTFVFLEISGVFIDVEKTITLINLRAQNQSSQYVFFPVDFSAFTQISCLDWGRTE